MSYTKWIVGGGGLKAENHYEVTALVPVTAWLGGIKGLYGGVTDREESKFEGLNKSEEGGFVSSENLARSRSMGKNAYSAFNLKGGHV